MKTIQLQYKMKKARPIKQPKQVIRSKVLNRLNASTADDFLESAEQFYRAQAAKQKLPTSRMHNPQLDFKKLPAKELQNTPRKHSDRITPDNLRCSLQSDHNSNLQHWRKQAFKFQEVVFQLQRKNIELENKNSRLKLQIKAMKQMNIKQEYQAAILKGLQGEFLFKETINSLEKELQSKKNRIIELESAIRVLSQLKNTKQERISLSYIKQQPNSQSYLNHPHQQLQSLKFSLLPQKNQENPNLADKFCKATSFTISSDLYSS